MPTTRGRWSARLARSFAPLSWLTTDSLSRCRSAMQTETEVRVPGDKSITHRALILAGLASGRSRIQRPLIGADTLATAAALRAFGLGVPEL
ncbi:MAG: hypothetical protein ACRELT_12840, partial [Longimicrobiales bacterium]